jgi:bifunctional DNA-binding transcriptional regulator/antitoxin component of YhaV-PrlF toxin-antitoxin module
MPKESITFYARISKDGKILIPTEIRRFHKIEGGESVKVLLEFMEEQ